MTTTRKKVKLTAGIDFRSSQSDQEFNSVGFFGPYGSKYSNDSLNQNQTGVYAALNLETGKGFNAEAGGRVNFHSEYGSNAVFNFNPSYLINEKVKIFGNLSTGYRTPSLYQLFSEYGNPELKPEAAFTVEAGLQYFSPKNKFMGRAVVFSRNVKDAIAFSNTFRYINQDKQKDHGFELEATYNPSSKVTLKTFYTFVTGEITTKTGNKDTTFNNLLRRPKNSFGINIGVQPHEKIYISSNLSVNGKRKDSYFDNQTFQVVNTTLKSYTLWDIYAEYSLCKKKLRLFANLRNILNSDYTEISGFNVQRFNMTAGARFNF
jgi:vitamin B12 transporter